MPTADELRERPAGDVRELAMDAIRALDAAEKEVERLRERYGKRFHPEATCAQCGGPLDACRDAVCCSCSPEPEVLAEVERLRSYERELKKGDGDER